MNRVALARASTRLQAPIWLLVSAAWLGPAILAAFQVYAQGRLEGEPVNWREIAWQGGDWFLYALLTPFVFKLAHRFPLARGHLARRVPLHFAVAVAFTEAWALSGILLRSLVFGRWVTPYRIGIVGWFLTSLPFGVAVYFAVVGVEHAARYFVDAKEREAQAARLSAQLAEARLGALRMQLQPHFLFNSLNAVTVVVRDHDTATATRVLERLGDMLRRVMRAGRSQEVTLAEELDFVEQYLAIELVRFADRLRPVFDVPPALRSSAVPEFVLQPLVENAVRHGLAQRTAPTEIRISARREGADLVLTVANDAPGPERASAVSGEGVGLANIRERLATLYGERASLDFVHTPGGGGVATVRLPWREAEPSGG